MLDWLLVDSGVPILSRQLILRSTLLKSVLSSLLIYFMSIFVIPKTLSHCLEKMMRRFLWGFTDFEAKIHLVEWNQVCSPIDHGGLGLRSLKLMKKALLQNGCGDMMLKRRRFGGN